MKHLHAVLKAQSSKVFEAAELESLLWQAYEKDREELGFAFYHDIRSKVCTMIGCHIAQDLCETEDEKAVFQKGMRQAAERLLEFVDDRIRELEDG